MSSSSSSSSSSFGAPGSRKMALFTAIIATIAMISGGANSFTTRVLVQMQCDASCSPTNENVVGRSDVAQSSSPTSPSHTRASFYLLVSSSSSPLGSGAVGGAVAGSVLLVTSTTSPTPTAGPTPGIFAKPVFATFVAFAAMSLSILGPLFLCACGGKGKKNTKSTTNSSSSSSNSSSSSSSTSLIGSLNDGDDYKYLDEVQDTEAISTTTTTPPTPTTSTYCSYYYYYLPLLFPTILDLIATALQAAAVLFIPAGINAALRGSLLLFTAAGASCSRSKEAGAGWLEWLGISISTMGAIGVGMSAFLNDDGTNPPPPAASATGLSGVSSQVLIAIGIGLSTLSNVVQGIQVAYETAFLEAGKYSALETNGIEGVFGVIITTLVLVLFQFTTVFGGADHGHVEDTSDTLCCLENTPSIVYVSIALFGQFALSTVAYMLLSWLRGGNFRALLMVGRGVLVWGAEFLCYYAFSANGGGSSGMMTSYGQPWGDYSWLAAFGFVVMGFGGMFTWKAQNMRERVELHGDGGGGRGDGEEDEYYYYGDDDDDDGDSGGRGGAEYLDAEAAFFIYGDDYQYDDGASAGTSRQQQQQQGRKQQQQQQQTRRKSSSGRRQTSNNKKKSKRVGGGGGGVGGGGTGESSSGYSQLVADLLKDEAEDDHARGQFGW